MELSTLRSTTESVVATLTATNRAVEALRQGIVRLDQEIADLKAEIEEIRRNGAGSGVTGQ